MFYYYDPTYSLVLIGVVICIVEQSEPCIPAVCFGEKHERDDGKRGGRADPARQWDL